MPKTLTIRPWPDPVLDTTGHDPRSPYAESFWLPTLGPSALLLLRHLAARFETHPAGIELPIADTSVSFKTRNRSGSNSPIVRSLTRLVVFGLACNDGATAIAVRRHLPSLGVRQLRHLPAARRAAHAQWSHTPQRKSPLQQAQRRARRMALVLIEQGDNPDHVERVLASTGFHPTLCRSSALWAHAQWSEFTRTAS